MKKFLILTSLLFLASFSQAEAARVFADKPVLLFERPARGSNFVEVTLPDNQAVSEGLRHTGGDLWLEVTVRGKKGWLFGGSFFVSLSDTEPDEAPLNEMLTHCEKARDAMFKGIGPDESWVRRPNVE